MSVAVGPLAYVEYMPAIGIPVSTSENPFCNARVTAFELDEPSTLKYGRFAEHYTKLKRIEADPSLWTSEDNPPSVESVAWARQVVQKLESYDLPPTKVVASAEGGAAVCLVSGSRYADIESLNTGAILGVLSDKRNRPFVWEIEPSPRGIAQAVIRIRDFIAGS